MLLNDYSRREFIQTAGVCVTAVALPVWLKAADRVSRSVGATAGKPNVLFILADDMRPDCIGALGNPNIKTPNLDNLVERGMSFTHAYCLGSNSGAVCMPSRTMILTGRSVFHISNGGFGNSCNDTYTPWAKAMSAGGYDTFHLGKRGNSFLPGMEAFDTCLYTQGIGADQHEVSSQKTADRIIEYLRGRNTAKPFFIYMAPPVPHDPRVAPKEFMDQYDPAKIPLPENFLPVHPFDNGEMTVRDEKLAPWPRTPEIVRRHLADDYACITCLDHHIGRIIDVLKDAEQLDNTIVIFAADNGLSIGEHGLFGKQNLYEFGGMHVPLIIAGPGIPRGKTGAFTYLYDLYPTVCELTGTSIPPEVESKSLVPVITGKAVKVRDYVFTAYRNCQRAVRNERWKLIRYPRINKSQLFDLEKDPHEISDLADKPECTDKVKEMMAILGKLQKEYDDSCPLISTNPGDPAWSPEKAIENQKTDSTKQKLKRKERKK
ncbi:MAG: sulfatase-like hydrolase/transferase [Kiritimatiellae bacterium]|nr:sulfatase-like hydrolase/transferase [Kiritimatiellia bacterium]MDD5519895.1 sulfatase-like hydrolase/transferase [Kiritimatiellia bacterium]